MWPFLSTDGEHRAPSAALVGRRSGVALRTWSVDDAVAYAKGIGAERGEPLPPTYATVLMQFGVEFPELGPWAVDRVLHAEQSMRLFEPLTPRGKWSVVTRVSDVRPLRTGVIVGISAEAVDARHGAIAARTRMGLFVRGDRIEPAGEPPAESDAVPDTPADRVVTAVTRDDQAELYARSGDRNPLHLDPRTASASGFDGPILHGLCTFGFAGRAVHDFLGRPPSDVSARFVAPVRPGDELRTEVWRRSDGAAFRVRDADDTVVLDRGSAA